MSSPEIVLDPVALATMCPVLKPEHTHTVIVPQMEQRVEFIRYWNIQPGERVLEIGCGQGDATVVLATAIGDHGHVTALDPASLDYGSPFTLGQAQAHLKSLPIGARIAFVQEDPLSFLSRTTGHYTSAVLSLCTWYFASPEYLRQLLSALQNRVSRICIAEYALTTSDPRSTPHLLAALTQAALECHKPVSKSNIRTVLSPTAIRSVASEIGFAVDKESVKPSVEGMLDGSWEVSAVLAEEWLAEVRANVQNEREKAVVVAMRDAVRANRDVLKEQQQKVRTMDIWIAVLQSHSKAG